MSKFQVSEIEVIEEKSLTRLLEFFQDVENFMEIQVKRENVRMDYFRFCNAKIMTIMDFPFNIQKLCF